LKRRFNKSEKAALFLAADGKSELSGEPLRDDWHADHIHPWSKGGRTDFSNAQALTRLENLRKSSKTMVQRNPREWQKRFFDKYNKHTEPDFLLAALPAAGKTFAALYLVNNFLRDNSSRRTVIVVPTLNIREQWKQKAHQDFSLDLQTKEFRGTLKTDFKGIVTTYQSVLNNSMLFRRFCAEREIFFVFDEIHHAAEHNQFGAAIKEAAEMANRRLLLTGTPFRTDRGKMPFVTLEDDGCVRLDEKYDYPEALRDGVIRELTFKRYGGPAKWRTLQGFHDAHSHDDQLSEKDWTAMLTCFLRSDDFMSDIYRDADSQLNELRRRVPNAGGLVVCEDIEKAKHQLQLLQKCTGEYPVLVHSDDDDSRDKLERFKTSSDKWIVAVQMISEGVDIPRLMCVVYATNKTTPLHFRQILGRVMRNQGTEEDSEAFVYAPDVEPLRTQMEEIEKFQVDVVKEVTPPPPPPWPPAPPPPPRYFEVIGATNEYTEMTSRGRHLSSEKSRIARNVALRFSVTEADAADIFEYIQSQHSEAPSENGKSQVREEKPKEDRLDTLRKSCTKKVHWVAKRRYGDHLPDHAHSLVVQSYRGWMTFKDKDESALTEFEEWLVRQLS
jgi:superfamily II DNA or RNA helicase